MISTQLLFFCSEFASLTHSQLMEKVRALQNLAYQLGVEEGEDQEHYNTLWQLITSRLGDSFLYCSQADESWQVSECV